MFNTMIEKISVQYFNSTLFWLRWNILISPTPP